MLSLLLNMADLPLPVNLRCTLIIVGSKCTNEPMRQRIIVGFAVVSMLTLLFCIIWKFPRIKFWIKLWSFEDHLGPPFRK